MKGAFSRVKRLLIHLLAYAICKLAESPTFQDAVDKYYRRFTKHE